MSSGARGVRHGFARVAVAGLFLAGCVNHEPLVLESRIEPEAIPVFYGGGRKHGAIVRLSSDEWTELRTLFEPAAPSSHDERVAIARAVQRLEQIVGAQTPTGADKAQNEKNPDWYGHQDCVDESTNTTIYLQLLQQHELLQHHVVLGRVRRTRWGTHMHWTAQIRDESDGTRYVVDSWFRDNGQPPYVQRAEDWEASAPLPDVIE